MFLPNGIMQSLIDQVVWKIRTSLTPLQWLTDFCDFFSFCQAQDLHYFAHSIYFFCYKFPLIPSPSHFSFLPFHHTCINTHIKCIHKHTQRDTEMQSYRNAQTHIHTHPRLQKDVFYLNRLYTYHIHIYTHTNLRMYLSKLFVIFHFSQPQFHPL